MSIVNFVRPGSRIRVLNDDVPKWISNNARASYIISVMLSAPPWVDVKALKALKEEAARLTKETGILHVLDHEIPVNHPRVCGLTVPWNLRIVHWRVNGSKGNTWCPEQMEMF